MQWEIINGLIDARLFIVLAACWVIGFVLKKTPKVQDWTIIFYVSAFSIVFAILMLGLSAESVIQCTLTAAVAVYGNQFIKQTKKGVEEDAERKGGNVQGIDVSRYQGKIDWLQVKADKREFVFIKAAEGQTYVDPNFVANVKGGVVCGPVGWDVPFSKGNNRSCC